MATAVNLKNRGPSAFQFQYDGATCSIPSGEVRGPFQVKVFDDPLVLIAVQAGRLVPSRAVDPAVSVEEERTIAVEEEGTIAVGSPPEDAPGTKSHKKRENN